MIYDPATASGDDFKERAGRIQNAIPQGGLFSEKAWRISPEPFPLTKKEVKALERLGPLLLKFQQPEALLELGLSPSVLDKTPRVIRPDLILTEEGFTATELDSVPGGIGLTAWLGEVYSEVNPHHDLVGGAEGMVSGFGSIFPSGEGDILISKESSDYRPEMEWITEKLQGDWSVRDAESYEPSDRDVYRFFELFDLPNIPGGQAVGKAAAEGTLELTSPFKPWLEEKLWSALFWSHPLKEVWRRELRDGNWRRLQKLFPMSWIVDPAEVPHHAVIPELGISHFSEMKEFSQTERDLVMKLSGFNEKAWGSRSVTIGQDVSQVDWADAVDTALGAFGESPYVLQRFHSGKLVTHPWLNPETGDVELMEGRVRLCPYYFVDASDQLVQLGGVLATICPSDKKILHGMSDAIMVPCRVAD